MSAIMAELQQKRVLFKKEWRGRPIGRIDTLLDIGIMSVLVARGIAEWHQLPGKVLVEEKRDEQLPSLEQNRSETGSDAATIHSGPPGGSPASSTVTERTDTDDRGSATVSQDRRGQRRGR